MFKQEKRSSTHHRYHYSPAPQKGTFSLPFTMPRTRFVCVSDTHGYSPSEAGFRLPKGNVLIHAGDITNRGMEKEFAKSVDWIKNADFEVKIVIAGNHDVTLDQELYSKEAAFYHKDYIQSSQRCIDLISDPDITYLNHSSETIRLKDPSGPKTKFKVFGSPYHPTLEDLGWSTPFSYRTDSADEARRLWNDIPLDSDIVVTHTPAKNHVDKLESHGHIGCEYLRQALGKVRPRLAICGHAHEGRGYQRVKWDVDGRESNSGNGFWKFGSVIGELPPRESRKQALVDLTGKTYPALDNDGSVCSHASATTEPSLGGRKETCFINAAILATYHPHKGGKKFNTPIVVDINLPLDEDGVES